MLTSNIQSYNNFYLNAFWDGFFSDEELNKIEQYCETQQMQQSLLAEGSVNTNIRLSRHCFVHVNAETTWFFEKLKTIVNHMNVEFFGYNLVGFDYFQYTVYDKKGSMYDTHIDLMTTMNSPLMRKLSFSLVLSDPDDYQGGDLEFLYESPPKKMDSKKGRLIAFPSFIPHRVTPMRKGVRKSIVVWALGPRFQ